MLTVARAALSYCTRKVRFSYLLQQNVHFSCRCMTSNIIAQRQSRSRASARKNGHPMLLRQISQSYLLAQWLNAAEGFFWNSEEAPNSRPNLKRVVIPFSSFHDFFTFVCVKMCSFQFQKKFLGDDNPNWSIRRPPHPPSACGFAPGRKCFGC